MDEYGISKAYRDLDALGEEIAKARGKNRGENAVQGAKVGAGIGAGAGAALAGGGYWKSRRVLSEIARRAPHGKGAVAGGAVLGTGISAAGNAALGSGLGAGIGALRRGTDKQR